jgi:hypothetical protein
MPPRPRDAHDALVDAKHNLLRYQVMTRASEATGEVRGGRPDEQDDDGAWAARA